MPWKRVAGAWKNLQVGWRILLICLGALVLAAGLIWLLLPGLSGEMVTTRQSPPPMDRKAEPMTRDQRVQAELEGVIRSWCDAEAGTYSAQSTLEGLWIRRFGPTSPYAPRGVVKLVSKIQDNEFFRRCEVGEGLFMPGGGIQTVGDLHFFLSPCGGGGA